uniref:Rho-GAP domain-containing protein n=1 Tax=Anas platyrhynchos platyrhynchos TaxID=8840 RepID=A0A493TZZ7_ANAPP
MAQEGLFRVNGSMKMVEQLRLQYERGEEVELVKDGDVYSAASLLKLFLRELPDGIISSALQPKFIQLYQALIICSQASPRCAILSLGRNHNGVRRERKLFIAYLVKSGLFVLFQSCYICKI